MVNSDALIEFSDSPVDGRVIRPANVSKFARSSGPANSDRTLQWLARSRSWVSIALLVPAFVVTAGSPLTLAHDSTVDILCQSTAWAFFMAGAVFRWWSTLYIGGRKTTELVTTGAYSICRNPIYLGTFLMQVSAVLFLESLTLAIATLIVAVYYLGVTVTAEERRLAAIYGADFQAYMATVPRLVPNFRLFRSPSSIQVEMGGLRSELTRMLRWMWIPVGCHLISLAREHQWWAPFTNWP